MRTKNRKEKIANYYNLQEKQDKLYAQSKMGTKFKYLMEIVTQPENIRATYRAVKWNKVSHTPGTDLKDIKTLAKMQDDEMVKKVQIKMSNYQPKEVRRVEIPKPNGKTRPLGIQSIEDRIIQQSILQVLEPICEAKFYESSHGFRPNRSAETALAEAERRMQLSHMTFVVNVDIKGFFDNVNHKKLLRQRWTLGIRDTKLLQVIKRMLKATIRMPDGQTEIPAKGTPQGEILSPLLANVVLNELDWRIASQWLLQCDRLKRPIKKKYNKKGVRNRGSEYKELRKSRLKEMYIVCYADDFKVFRKTEEEAERIKHAVTKWLKYRLKLETPEEKTKITNLRKKSCEFLGFKLKLRRKRKKEVVEARVCDKAVKQAKNKLKDQIKRIQKPRDDEALFKSIGQYNSMVVWLQNYYGMANNVCKDLSKIQHMIDITIKKRLEVQKTEKISNQFINKRYGKSRQVRWLMGMPIIPIGYHKSRNPRENRKSINQYTAEGRKEIFESPDIDVVIMTYIMCNPVKGRTIEYNDNRISLYVGQHGKCAITGQKLEIGEMHCHHVTPKHKGGNDGYRNLVFVTKTIHRLIHATDQNIINKYLDVINLNNKQIKKLNSLRVSAGLNKVQ